jgi:hypothetical protein
MPWKIYEWSPLRIAYSAKTQFQGVIWLNACSVQLQLDSLKLDLSRIILVLELYKVISLLTKTSLWTSDCPPFHIPQILFIQGGFK